METNSMEEMFAKALCEYSSGRISLEEAERRAPSAVKTFLEWCERSQTLASKGIVWYAREVAKAMDKEDNE